MLPPTLGELQWGIKLPENLIDKVQLLSVPKENTLYKQWTFANVVLMWE